MTATGAKIWLQAAGVYNLVWGAIVIAFPHWLFDACGIPRLNYPEIWQCVGMIVGVYGIGYLSAARDPWRHWPIVLVGLLGKLLGPIGFAKALIDGTFPPAFGLTILTNDLLWWIPFALILRGAYRHAQSGQNQDIDTDDTDQHGSDRDHQSQVADGASRVRSL
jgi:small multidrug resistance pump